MTNANGNAAAEIFSDQILSFTVTASDARGRAVRLDNAVNAILSAHDYPAPIAHLLAEALTLTCLMGSLLKESGAQMTMQTQSQTGVIRLLVCDYRGGELRGYVDYDRESLDALGDDTAFTRLFSDAYMAITFDRPKQSGEKSGRYQGIVPLEGDSLAASCENYFVQSEQVPTMIRIATNVVPGFACSGGLLLQYLPDGEDGRERLHAREETAEWHHIAIMGGSIRREELLDPELSMEAMIWRLFHEEQEVRHLHGDKIHKGCRCSVEHYTSVLSQFPEEERAEMRDESGVIKVDCAFCAQVFPIAL